VTPGEIKLQIDDKVKQLVEERHILEDEVKQVIYHGKTEGEKPYIPDENRYLAKMRKPVQKFCVLYTVTHHSGQ